MWMRDTCTSMCSVCTCVSCDVSVTGPRWQQLVNLRPTRPWPRTLLTVWEWTLWSALTHHWSRSRRRRWVGLMSWLTDDWINIDWLLHDELYVQRAERREVASYPRTQDTHDTYSRTQDTHDTYLGTRSTHNREVTSQAGGEHVSPVHGTDLKRGECMLWHCVNVLCRVCKCVTRVTCIVVTLMRESAVSPVQWSGDPHTNTSNNKSANNRQMAALKRRVASLQHQVTFITFHYIMRTVDVISTTSCVCV